MRAVVRIHASQGGGASSATHYVAWDGLDPEREGEGARPLFTNDGRDGLTYYGADRYLTDGRGAPARDDLIHISVSFRQEDFEALGATDEERAAALGEVAREAMEEVKNDLREEHYKLRGYRHTPKRQDSHLDWRWVAGVHLNTRNPHIHFLVHKNLLERDPDGGSEKVLRVGRIPKRLLARKERDPDGQARPVEGVIGSRFVTSLERAQDRAREILQGRSILGMDQSSSYHDLKFEYALVDRGVEHWTIETYYQAGKLSAGDLDMRRYVASLSPAEARRAGRLLDSLRRLTSEQERLQKSDGARRAKLDEERRGIIEAFPQEVRAFASRADVRADWPEIRAGVLWTAVRHGFSPGAAAYQRLLSTGERELDDGSRENLAGRFLMRIREEGRQREDDKQRKEGRLGIPKGFLDSLSDETRSWLRSEVLPVIERLVEAGKTRAEIFAEIDRRTSYGRAPTDERARNTETAEIDRIDAILKARVHLSLHSDDRLLELAERNPSPGGRELTKDLILRGPAPEPDGPPDALNDMREAFRERRLDETEYASPHTRADQLRKYSQELARLYENGAVIKDGVVVLPAEGHELTGLTDSRAPFITELRYALSVIDDKEIGNKEKAVEFHDLARKIAGRTADGKDQFGYFRFFYDQLKRGADGRYLGYEDKEARRQALERTLEEMRTLAPDMEKQESLVSIDSRGGDDETLLSVEAIAGAELEKLSTAEARGADGPGPGDYRGDEDSVASVFRQEVAQIERMARGRQKGADLAIDDSEEWASGFDEGAVTVARLNDDLAQAEEPDENDLEGAVEEALPGDKEEDKYETRAGSFVFNTAARTVNLRDESLRFPAGLNFEDRAALVEVHLPHIDAKIEAGRRPEDILRDISLMVLDWNQNLSEEGAERQKLWEQNDRIGSFLRAYAKERLRDPETRALNVSEAFRDAHARIAAARAPEELIHAVSAARKSSLFNERERRLLFCGRAPAHHTPEMREIRMAGWLTLDERARALSDGRLPMSAELKGLLAELDARERKGQVDYFVIAVKTPLEKMQKPEESRRLGLWERREKLPEHELKFLLDKTWEKKQSFADRNPSRRETASQPGDSRPAVLFASRSNESLRIYREGVEGEKRRLAGEFGDRRGAPLAQEELDRIHERAVRLAFDRLVPAELFEGPLEGAKKELSDQIADLQERVQPQLRLAVRARGSFYREKIGADRPSEPTHLETLGKLGPEDRLRMSGIESYVEKMQAELSRGFAEIDRLRQELLHDRGAEEVKATPAAARGTVPSVSADQPGVARDADVSGRSKSSSTPRIDSYREYLGYVAEIERQLISEALRQRAGAEQGGDKTERADQLLTLEERRGIRAAASDLALARLERPVYTNEPEALKLLPLSEAISEAVARLHDEALPQAREAALRLDEFIRSNFGAFIGSRAPEQLAEMMAGGGLYYRGDRIPEGELRKLTPEKQTQLELLKKNAAQTRHDFESGFRQIDEIRRNIERIEKAAPDFYGARKSPTAPTVGPVDGAIKDNSLHDRDASLDEERKRDRRLLGDLVITRALAFCAALDYETARDHGHTFRFKVHDESLGADRRISHLDIHRRAASRGDRAADERGAERKDERLAIRGQISDADLRRHRATLDEHGKKLGKLTSELGSKAKEASAAHGRAQRLAGEVIEKYQKRGEQLPTPFVEREALVRAQDEAVKHGFADFTEKLERLRAALAEEHDQPARSDREASRLAAQVFVANTELSAREERAVRFDETRHIHQWEIGGEKISLAEIDRRVADLGDASVVFGRHALHLDPGTRKAASAEIERLKQIRQEIIEKTIERQREMREETNEARKLLETVASAYASETAQREQSGASRPAPRFTREELDRAADSIETVRDATLLRQLAAFEKRFNTYADPKERFSPAEGWGRAPARATLAEIFHRESSERLAAFERRGNVQSLLVETPDGRFITHRLEDTRPRSLVELIARPIAETEAQRELRHGVEQAFARHEGRLNTDLQRTRSYLEAAREIASSQATERSARAGRELPAPEAAMTPKQAMTIEIHAERQTDPTERERLLGLARGSDLSHVDSHSHTKAPDSHSRINSPEPQAAREVAPGLGRGR